MTDTLQLSNTLFSNKCNVTTYVLCNYSYRYNENTKLFYVEFETTISQVKSWTTHYQQQNAYEFE